MLRTDKLIEGIKKWAAKTENTPEAEDIKEKNKAGDPKISRINSVLDAAEKKNNRKQSEKGIMTEMQKEIAAIRKEVIGKEKALCSANKKNMEILRAKIESLKTVQAETLSSRARAAKEADGRLQKEIGWLESAVGKNAKKIDAISHRLKKIGSLEKDKKRAPGKNIKHQIEIERKPAKKSPGRSINDGSKT